MERGPNIMSQRQEGFESLTKTSSKSTEIASPEIDSRDNHVVLRPPTPTTEVDDKAAALESVIESLKSELRKERFVFIFVIITLFDGLILQTGSIALFWYFAVSSLILLIGLARWLEFPWVIVNLEGWLNRLGRAFDKKFLGKNDDIEPA